MRYSSLLVQAYHTPPRCGGSSRLFGELCKYGFDLSGKGEPGKAPVPNPTLETNKQRYLLGKNWLFEKMQIHTTSKRHWPYFALCSFA